MSPEGPDKIGEETRGAGGDGSLTREERGEEVVTRSRALRGHDEAAAEQRLVILNDPSRAFASTVRATMTEQKRLAREHECSLERAARAEAEAPRARMDEGLRSIEDASRPWTAGGATPTPTTGRGSSPAGRNYWARACGRSSPS